jgi:hypothetical protein
VSTVCDHWGQPSSTAWHSDPVRSLCTSHHRTSMIHSGKILERLKKLAVGPKAVLIVQVFDSILYIVAPKEGGLIPTF